MPRILDTMTSQSIGGTNYGFSGTRVDVLANGSSAYTLGVIVLDVSGSTASFRTEMEKCLKEIIRACRRNPRADSMLIRVVLFDNRVVEFHGFKPLLNCNEDDYTGCLGTNGGSTSLYDALYTAVKATNLYGADLVAKEFDVNAIVIGVTDGQEYPPNASTATRKMIKEALAEGVSGECLESMRSILVGLNANGQLDQYLQDLVKETGFDQYVAIDKADQKTLTKLGGWVSQSISSQSQALGTGGPSQSLIF